MWHVSLVRSNWVVEELDLVRSNCVIEGLDCWLKWSLTRRRFKFNVSLATRRSYVSYYLIHVKKVLLVALKGFYMTLATQNTYRNLIITWFIRFKILLVELSGTNITWFNLFTNILQETHLSNIIKIILIILIFTIYIYIYWPTWSKHAGYEGYKFVRGGFLCHATCHNGIGWNTDWTFKGTGVEPKTQPKAQK